MTHQSSVKEIKKMVKHSTLKGKKEAQPQSAFIVLQLQLTQRQYLRNEKIIITQSSYLLRFHCWPNWSSFKINITFN